MAIWSRDKQFGGGSGAFNSADGADDANNNSIVPATTRFGMIFSNIVDNTLNRSKWLCTALYRGLQSQVHKEEDRATGANIGVSGTEIETSQTVYTTPEQLPEVDKLINDFTVSVVEADGDLSTTQDMFTITTVNTDRKNKSFKINFSAFGVKWLLARTWLQSEIESLISTSVNPTDGTGLIPVGTEFDRGSLDDPTGYLNLCNGTRTIAKTNAATATLKDDKYKNLFVFLHVNYSDTLCPVSTGRGGTGSVAANLDWEAGKNIQLPDYRGKVAGYYKGSDTNFGEIGKEIGLETIEAIHLPVTSPWRAVDSGHSHGYTNTKYNNTSVGENAGSGEDARLDEVDTRPTPENAQANITMTTNNILGGNIADGGQKHFQPTKITTRIIKY